MYWNNDENDNSDDYRDSVASVRQSHTNSAILVKKKKTCNTSKKTLNKKKFKDWLSFHDDIPFCNACQRSLSSRSYNLSRHAVAPEHVENCKKQNSNYYQVSEEPNYNEKIAELELILAEMFSLYGWAFKTVPGLINHLRLVDPGCVWDDVKLGKTKIRDLITNVIGKEEKDRLAEILQTNYFSVCLDESTDISNTKDLAIQLRYADPCTGHVVSQLWEFASIFKDGQPAKSGSEEMFDSLKASFGNFGIPLNHILAYCTDACTTMIGQISGLKARLEAEVPNIIGVVCVAHILHNCTKHAMMILPTEVLDLIQNIYTMLKSANKSKDFMTTQENLDLPIHKILRLVLTRWLSLLQVIDQYIEQWRAIDLFSEQLALNNDVVGTKVFASMKKYDCKLYLYSLQHILRKINNLNLFFQRDDVIIHLAQEEIEKTYKNIVSCVLKRDYVKETAASDIDLFDESKYLPFIDFELGDSVRQAFIENGAVMEDFCAVIINFVLVLALEMKSRFNNFKNDLLVAATCLRPLNALSLSFHKDFDNNFSLFLQVFRHIIDDSKQLYEQWRNLPVVFSCNDPDLKNMKLEDFWFSVFSYKNEAGEQPFRKLGSIFLISSTTPHANAGPEREFSDKKNLKTRNRNLLNRNSVNALIRTRETIRKHCVNNIFRPTSAMIGSALTHNYYKYKLKKKN